jgi:hypothetical protein
MSRQLFDSFPKEVQKRLFESMTDWDAYNLGLGKLYGVDWAYDPKLDKRKKSYLGF